MRIVTYDPKATVARGEIDEAKDGACIEIDTDTPPAFTLELPATKHCTWARTYRIVPTASNALRVEWDGGHIIVVTH